MNLNRFLFTACFISISAIASAQEKGYYSIGNNAGKLRMDAEYKPVDSFVRAEKGYYNIEPNRRKLRRSLNEEKANQRRIPEIKKGYYSIGNNASRLNQKAN